MSTLMNSEGVQFEAHNVLDGAPTTFTSEKAKYQWLVSPMAITYTLFKVVDALTLTLVRKTEQLRLF